MYYNKIFLKESGQEQKYQESHSSVELNTGLDGNEARRFYEELIGEETEPNKKPIPKPKRKRKKNVSKKIDYSAVNEKELFILAQNNVVDKLELLISSGVDINKRDSFGWTSLMCAACSGAEEAVELLLNAGADITANDPGYNALHLAKKNKHSSIIKLIKNATKKTDGNESESLKLDPGPFYCEICKDTFRGDVNHESSTVHLLAKNSGKPKTFYGIPDSNKGFQLLMKHGWHRENGLGPEGEGRKFPVKATIKQDRLGIGAKVKKKKEQQTDATRSEAGSSAFERSLSKDHRQKDRAFERSFRSQFL